MWRFTCASVFDSSLEVFCNILFYFEYIYIYMQVQLRSAQFEGEVCFRCACHYGSLILLLFVSVLHVQAQTCISLVTKPHTIVEAYFDIAIITIYVD